MANRHRGEIAVDISGKEYLLRFGINECCDLEDKLGRSIVGIAEMMSTPELVSITMIRTLFWIGIKKHHPVSEFEAGELLGDADLNAVMEKIGEAFEAAFPTVDVDENPMPGEAKSKAGIGLNS